MKKLNATRSEMPPQENRREYEKRVAAIVEQSWLHYTDDEGAKMDVQK